MGLVAPVVFSKACSVGPSPPRLPLLALSFLGKGRGISAPTRPVYFINEIVFSNRFDYLFKGRVPEQLPYTMLCSMAIDMERLNIRLHRINPKWNYTISPWKIKV